MATEGRTWDDVREKLERVDPLALDFNLNPDLTTALSSGASYPDLFQSAFGDSAITAERIGFALATYQRTLNPDQTPWDRFQAGIPGSMSQNQIQGMNFFSSPGARCNQCHQPPLFSDGSFRNLGLRPGGEDSGRRGVTGNFADRAKFKVPSLRNVGLRPRFMHQGEFGNFSQVFDFYDDGGGGFGNNLDPLMNNINIPGNIENALQDFLANALTDPRVASESPPFDRPRLNTERATSNPAILTGFAHPGSGGFAPTIIAETPPRLGSQNFRIGVHNALGDADGFFVFYLTHPDVALTGRRWAMHTSGVGPGNGYSTFQQSMPNMPALAGLELWAQFWVVDPVATGGLSRSDVAHYTLY
ncbi:MAG: hypothetical protein ACI835_003215 [Planctomycetota bacterium]|jgi:hypothetical protein